MNFVENGKIVECWDYCFYRCGDTLFGCIRIAEDGGYVFHPARKVMITTRMLADIFEYQKKLNRARRK